MRRAILFLAGVVATAAVAASAGVLVRSAAAAPPQEDPDFEGFVVEQEGEVRVYPQKDGWEASPGPQTFTLERRGLRITYCGDFVAEERRTAKRSEQLADVQKSSEAFTVVAGGKQRFFPAAAGWTGSLNTTGLFVRRRGQTVWFYGTARVEEPR